MALENMTYAGHGVIDIRILQHPKPAERYTGYVVIVETFIERFRFESQYCKTWEEALENARILVQKHMQAGSIEGIHYVSHPSSPKVQSDEQPENGQR